MRKGVGVFFASWSSLDIAYVGSVCNCLFCDMNCLKDGWANDDGEMMRDGDGIYDTIRIGYFEL